jgi:hypothetical protein
MEIGYYDYGEFDYIDMFLTLVGTWNNYIYVKSSKNYFL